jgi:TP901 family phage tail tape measure protein
MPGAKGIEAARAFVRFYADTSPYVRAVRKIEGDLKAFGSRMVKIGAGITAVGVSVAAAMVPLAMQFASTGDKLSKMSQRSGAAAESLSFLQYAAESNGAALSDVESALGTVQDKLNDAAAGSLESAMAFGRLGLSLQTLGRMKPEDRFAALVDRLGKVKNPALQAALATDVFGGSAEALLPLIRNGSQGLQEMRDRAAELGLVMDNQTAKAGENLTQAMYDLQSSISGVWNQVGAALAPVLTEAAKAMASIVGTISKWVKENRQLVATVFKVAVAVAAIGAVISIAGAVFFGIGAAVGALVSMMTALGAALAFVLSPFGLLLAGLVAGAVYFFGFTDAGKKAIDDIKKYVVGLYERFTEIWGGITDAVMSGDLALAGQIAFLALQVAWQSVMNTVMGYWNGFTTYLLDTWDVASNSVAVLLVDAFAGIRTAWLETTNFMAEAWDNFSTGLMSAWKTAQFYVAHGVITILDTIKMLADAMADLQKMIGGLGKTVLSSLLPAGSALLDIGTGVSQAAQKMPDTADMRAELNAEFKRQQEQAAAGLEQRSMDRSKEANKSRDNIEADRQGQRAELGAGLKASLAKRQQANQGDEQAGQDALAKAQAALDAAIKEANDKRKNILANGESGDGTSSSGGSVSFKGVAKQSIAGTFSGAAAARLGGQGPMDQIARNTADTARYTRQIANQEPVKTT